MDLSQIRVWESAVDTVEQTPLAGTLPTDAAVGDWYQARGEDGVTRRWQRVLIVGGNVGGRWAYWAPWQQEYEVMPGDRRMRPGVGPNPDGKVVVDKIFNGDAAHFMGMCAVPYVGRMPGVDQRAWVLVEPKMAPPEIRYVEVEREENRVRYEKSDEVHDVATGTTTKLNDKGSHRV